MIALLLVLAQVAAPVAAPVAPGAEPAAARIAAIDPAQAVELFRTVCVPNVGDADALEAAIVTAGGFVEVARRGEAGDRLWRGGQALLSFGTASDGSRHCALRGRVRGAVDQLSFAARVATALAARGAKTRTASGQAVTEWTVAVGGRPARVSAATRNAAGGDTDIRLSAMVAR